MKYQRAKNLSDHDVQAIVAIINEWTGKLTWDSLCSAIGRRTRESYTRQALFAHKSIRSAFRERKEVLKTALPDSPGSTERGDNEELISLRAQVTTLQQQLDSMRDQFAVWAYNAYSKGLSESDLWRPLPDVDRDRTEELQARRKVKRKSEGDIDR